MKEDLWFNLTQALPIHSPANPAGLTAMNTPTMLGGGPVVSNGNITCQDRMAVMPVGVTIQPNGNYGTGNFKCMTLDDCICLGGPFPVFNTGDRVELCMSVQDPNYSCPQSNPPTPCAPPPMIPSCKYGTIDSRRGTVDLDAMHNGCPYLDNNCTPGSTQNYPDLPTVTNYGITWDDGTTTWDYKPKVSTQPLGIIPTPQPLPKTIQLLFCSTATNPTQPPYTGRLLNIHGTIDGLTPTVNDIGKAVTYTPPGSSGPSQYEVVGINPPHIQNDPNLGRNIPMYDTHIAPVSLTTTTACNPQPVEILGCTNNTATNYNPAATLDDMSCSYPPPPDCCLNPNVCGPESYCSNCLCRQDPEYHYLPRSGGCTDSSADNYDPGARTNDGSCTYPADVFALPEEEVPAGSKVTIQFGDGCGPFKNPTQMCTLAFKKFTGTTTGRMANRSSDGTQTWEVDWGLSPSDGTPTLSWHPASEMIEIIPPTPILPPLPVEVIETTKTTKTAGVGDKSNLLMYLLIGGGLYYAFSQGMFKKLLK